MCCKDDDKLTIKQAIANKINTVDAGELFGMLCFSCIILVCLVAVIAYFLTATPT